MSHSIKVSDKVFNLLLKYQAPRETFSGVIERAFAGLEALANAQSLTKRYPHLVTNEKEEVK